MESSLNYQGRQPPDITVAFALALIKSKPPDLSVKDYILSLRSHISVRDSGASDITFTTTMNAGSYWRTRDSQTRCELECAQRERSELQLEIEALKQGSNPSDAHTALQKRKKPVSDIISRLSKKKIRREVSSPSYISEARHTQSGINQSPALKALLPDLFRLEMILGTQDTSKAIELPFYVERVAETLSQVLHEILTTCYQDGLQDTNPCGSRGPREDLAAFGRAFTTLVACCGLFRHTSDEAVRRSKVVYAIVKIFKNITNVIRDMSRQAAATIAEQGFQQTNLGRCTRSKAILFDKASGRDASKVVDTVNALATVLGDAFDLLDPDNDVHKCLFEGFAYCVLSRLGDQLFAVVFGHEKGPTLESEIERSGTIRSNAYSEAILSCDAHVRLEAPCWVHLLKRVMSAAPGFLDHTAGDGGEGAGEADVPILRQRGLADHALRRLQRTLVSSMIGTEDHGQDETVVSRLRMPIPDDTQIPVPETKDPDITEWLKGEIWNILGWEILSKGNLG